MRNTAMSNFSKNIPKLNGIKISKWFNLVMPIVVLFYQDNGMGMQEIFMLKAIYSVAIVTMEIPSGWMADVWGRRKTLIFGSILGSAGFLMYSFSYGFWAFVAAEIILGIGHSFVSGADSALLFDSLKADNKDNKYVMHEGRISSAGNFAEAIAGVAGGFLAAISLRTPFYFQFAVATMAIPAAFSLVEPKIHTSEHLRSIKKISQNIYKTLSVNRDLRIAVLLSSLSGTATLTFAWLVQPFFKAIELPVEMFGIFWTALNLTVGVSSVLAYKAEIFLGRKKTLFFIILLLSAGYVFSGMAINYWGITFLFVFYFVRGIATPILKNYINVYTSNEIRATLLSVRNFLIRIIFALVGPLLGWVTDHINLKTAFIFAGLVYLISMLIVAIPWLKRN